MQTKVKSTDDRRQLTCNVMMIRPTHFDYNTQTAQNNAFQDKAARLMPSALTQSHAAMEFDALVDKLISLGMNIEVIEDSSEPYKPDAIFPNNWISFHEDGQVILYPMFAPNRRYERRPEIIEYLQERYEVSEVIDLSYFEEEDKFLESTGSMIFDHANRIAYACLSPRTNADVMQVFAEKSGYRLHIFEANDQHGQAIYHTNVMMNVGEGFAVVCMDSVSKPEERKALRKSLEENGKAVLSISFEQMNHFAGNMLELKNTRGSNILVMSEQAYKSLEVEQVKFLERHAIILQSPLYIIEQNGGGSARCMIAEIFLKPKR